MYASLVNIFPLNISFVWVQLPLQFIALFILFLTLSCFIIYFFCYYPPLIFILQVFIPPMLLFLHLSLFFVYPFFPFQLHGIASDNNQINSATASGNFHLCFKVPKRPFGMLPSPIKFELSALSPPETGALLFEWGKLETLVWTFQR